MFEYQFKRLPELAWAVAVAAVTVAVQMAAQTDVRAVDDWQTWVVALGAAVGRAALAAAISWVTAKPPELPPPPRTGTGETTSINTGHDFGGGF